MHTICSPYGQVLRIVIFKKNGVQTMVEYPFAMSEKHSITPALLTAFYSLVFLFPQNTPFVSP